AAPNAIDEFAERRVRPLLAHHPDSRKRSRSTAEGHQPAEAAGRNLPSQIDLDVVDSRERNLALRAVNEEPRQAEPELPIEAIVRAAGEDARPSVDGPERGRNHHAIRFDVDLADPASRPDLCSRRRRVSRQRGVESSAIDDRGAYSL